MKKKVFKNFGYGLLVGLVNGMFGSGGGMLAVPLLKNSGFHQKEAHKNAVAVILPITLISACLYLLGGRVKISDALPFVPLGLVGAALGTFVIQKVSNRVLKKVFALFMIWAGVRMFI